MKLERAVQIGELLTGIAVMVSVIFLAVQLSDNNRLLRSQTHFNALEVSQRPMELLLENDTLAVLMHQCDIDPGSIPVGSWSRCAAYYFMTLNAWEYTFYQYRDDAVPFELWVGLDNAMSYEVKSKAGMARFWTEMSGAFGEPFRSYVDARVRENPAYVGQAAD